MKGYILRASALWVRGLILALLSVSLVALFTRSAYAVKFAKTYGGASNDYATSVRQTSDGGYIVAGETRSFGWYSDIILIKTDANGNIRWAKTYGGTRHDYAYSVQQTSDGGYIVAGVTLSIVSRDIILIKTDTNGNRIWDKTYDRTNDFVTLFANDYAYSVQQTSDGGYIVAGYTSLGGDNIILLKTDANGNISWAKIYRVTDGHAYSVRQTSDGGYIVAGRTLSSSASSWDVFLIKTDTGGNIRWAKTYGSWGDVYAYSVQQTSDGGYIVAGYTNSFGADSVDILLIKTDANGDIGCSTVRVRNVTPTVGTVSPTVDSSYFFSGPPTLLFNSVSSDVSQTLTVNEPCPLSDDNELGISESCQPASGLITQYKGGIKITKSGEFEVKVYNVSGVMVKSVKGKNEIKLELSRGVYFVEVVSGGKVLRKKVIIR
jgi:hypothetical protein